MSLGGRGELKTKNSKLKTYAAGVLRLILVDWEQTPAKREDMAAKTKTEPEITPESPAAFINRELSWLQFARRVLELVEDVEVPLLERVKFAGILGMLHDEFFMKRISGLKRQVRNKVDKLSLDGLRPIQELKACRKEILSQSEALARVLREEIRPGLAVAGVGILDWVDLDDSHRSELAGYFKRAVLPILTPLAVDAEHPFPFISNLGVNLAVTLREKKKKERFVRIKVPANRNRWVPLADGSGFVPLEQLIAANLDQLFPGVKTKAFLFRVTRAATGEGGTGQSAAGADALLEPGSIIRQVTDELKARRFAGKVRLQVSADTPRRMRQWLAKQLKVDAVDVYVADHFRRRPISDFRGDPSRRHPDSSAVPQLRLVGAPLPAVGRGR